MRKLEKKTSSGNGMKPFLQQAYDQGLVQDRDCLEVFSVRETKNKAGILLETAKFVCLVYKSSEWYSSIIDICVEMVETDPGNALMLAVEPEETDGFELYVDTDEARLWTVTKKFGGVKSYEHLTSGKGATKSISRKSRRAIQEETKGAGSEF